MSIGTFTVGASPTLNGTLLMEIDREGSPNADKLVVSGNPLAFGGTLVVANIGAALQGGEQFDLFDATAFSGAFSATNLPPLASGLNWWAGRLYTEGKLVVNRAPTVANAAVLADVVEHIRGEKKLTFKKKRRKGYTKTIGHRQELTVVKIKSINA